MYQYQTISPYWATLMPPIDGYTPPSGIPGIPKSVITEQYIDDRDIINIGSGNQTIGGGSGNPSPVAVTLVTTSTYTALATDYFICVDTATAPATITLPTGILGTVYIIKDCSGDSFTNPITVGGSGGQLVDGSTGIINTSYGSIELIFNGAAWSIS